LLRGVAAGLVTSTGVAPNKNTQDSQGRRAQRVLVVWQQKVEYIAREKSKKDDAEKELTQHRKVKTILSMGEGAQN